jgi:hypothetical protein
MWPAAPAEASRRPAEADPGFVKGTGGGETRGDRQGEAEGRVNKAHEEPSEGEVGLRKLCHARERGHPVIGSALDSRLRGNDNTADFASIWKRAA